MTWEKMGVAARTIMGNTGLDEMLMLFSTNKRKHYYVMQLFKKDRNNEEIDQEPRVAEGKMCLYK